LTETLAELAGGTPNAALRFVNRRPGAQPRFLGARNSFRLISDGGPLPRNKFHISIAVRGKAGRASP
jgi:hypothetical protein